MTTKNTYDPQVNFLVQLRQTLQLGATDNETLFKVIMNTFEERDDLTTLISELRTERDELVRDEVCNPAFLRRALRRILSKHVELMQEPSDVNLIGNLTVLLDELVTERNTIRPTATHDPRYIVHGHVQPCVLLYSDETTTLVRLDGGDMMCETDTIQWSDALTYRCQELLASAGLERGSMAAQRVLPVLSELVRDERVTLNDEGVAVEQPEFVAPVVADDPVIEEQQRYEAYCERMKARNETIPHIADWRLMGSPTPYVRRAPRK